MILTCTADNYIIVAITKLYLVFYMQVFGDKGFVTVDNVLKTPVTIGTSKGIAQTPYIHSFPTRYAEAYHNEMMHFLDVLNDRSITLKVTKEDAERATKLASACIASFTSKRAELIGTN